MLQILVLNTHFQSGHEFGKDLPAKQDSARRMQRCIAALIDKFRLAPTLDTHIPHLCTAAPILVTGDFNTQKQHPLVWKILQGIADITDDPRHATVPGTALHDVFHLWQEDCPEKVRC